MKFFFRAETKTASRLNGEAKPLRWRGALSVALAALCVVGCVGRKQYAINEAILISERRQLEDEIYRLQFELRDALEENERLRQELGGDAAPANSPAARTRARSKANDAFFPGLDATQTRRQTTGGARQIQTTSANDATSAPVLRTDRVPQNAESAPATGEAVETLPDYVPIPVTSTRLGQATNGVRAAQNVGKTLGVRRVAPVAASNANGGNVVSSVFVDSPSTKETSRRPTNAAAWSPLAQ